MVVTHEPDVAARARRVIVVRDGLIQEDRAERATADRRGRSAMRPGDIVRVALRALLRNKLRSLLTALGIIIGVAAVIAMVAIGEGARARVEQAFSAMGTNVLIVSSGAKTSGRRQGGRRFVADADLGRSARDPRRRRGRSLRRAARPHDRPGRGRGPQLVDGRDRHDARVLRDPQLAGAHRAPCCRRKQVDSGAKAVVLGQTVAANLFGASSDPIGQTMRIANVPFQVVGVATAKGQSASGNDYDDVVYVPVSTFLAKIQGSLQKFIPGTILIEVTSDDVTTAVAERVCGAAARSPRHRAGR